MSRARRQIFVDAKARKKLMDHFKCYRNTLSNAIYFRFNSALEREIRSYAVNFLECPIILLEVNRL